ncbi:tetratricopeptide repeat protein [Nonomuraea rubra]|uniref:nSTAND1 domain-containing NTPase n=1 Tax=Nonomuraea rubra TaxID=46180 RepID=UPI003325259C
MDGGPYAGPRPFATRDAHRFFGRSPSVAWVAKAWQERKLTILSGSSGVGKTSLIQAGVLPQLSAGRFDILPMGRVFDGLAFPVAALPDHNPYTFALLRAWRPTEPPTRLAGLTVSDFLRRRKSRTDWYGNPVATLAAIDQFEQLFQGTIGTAEQRDAFVAELAEALDAHHEFHLLISVRDEHLPDVVSYSRLMHDAVTDRFRLQPFTPEAALDAVRGPVTGSGRFFAEGVPEEIVRELRAGPAGTVYDTVEPALLQAACFHSWRALPGDHGAITTEDLAVNRALAEFVGEAVLETAHEHSVPAEGLLSWLRSTFGGGGSTVEERSGQVAGLSAVVVRALQSRHVLKAEWRSGARHYRLQHERLAGPLRSATVPSPEAPTAEDSLRAAEYVLFEGDLGRAHAHAESVMSSPGEIRLQGQAASLLGNIAYAQGRLAEAETHYRKAAVCFEVVQDNVAVGWLFAVIGRVLAMRRDWKPALDAFEAALKRCPDDPQVRTELGRTLWLLGRPRAALSMLNDVLDRTGDHTEALRVRGQVLADLGQARDALRDLDRVPDRPWHQRSPAIRAARAVALAGVGSFDAAREESSQAVEDEPANGPVLLYAAEVASLTGDGRSAQELVRRALAADQPELPPHQRERALLVQRLPER